MSRRQRESDLLAMVDAAEERAKFWHDQFMIRGGLLRGTEEALMLAYRTNAAKDKRLTDLMVRDGHRVIRGLILPDLMRPEPGRSVGSTPIYDALVGEVGAA